MSERTEHPWLSGLPGPLLSFLSSPRLSAALTTAAIGTAAGAGSIRRLIGVPGLFAVLAALVVFMAVSYAARWRQIEAGGANN